jgi:acyl-coenzyme A synthetase/AMP-(fatty) acid ligase
VDDVVLQKTPFSFDVSVWEFFWPLMTGARLVVARPEGHRDPAYLAEVIERERVTTVHFVPSMLSAFLDGADAGRCASLRRVVCSGEALSAELAARFHARMPSSTELHNLYGPTEAAVDVTYHPCVRDDARRTVPIGRPVANTQVHVLEPSGEPAPVGVPGELHIGGVQVGLGYLGRPALTAERFVPDPFSPIPGARLYRTGDRARWTAEGAVEYLGRLDFQVKVRGLRIELGEIEAALVAHPSVRAAVVALRAGPAGDPLLVAYVVADGGGADADALREHLKRSLPEYMVPAAFVPLEALPLSPNGKLDRRALPDPDFAANARAYVAPRTPVERVVAGIWAELLKAERVGVEDDFFALGGHSLLAVQAAARAREAFGVEIPLGYVFSRPTVAGLSAALATDPATGSRVEQVAALLEMLSGVSEDDARAMLSHHSPPQEPVR